LREPLRPLCRIAQSAVIMLAEHSANTAKYGGTPARHRTCYLASKIQGRTRRMRSITPRDREVPFRIDEMFYSRTDKRGVIAVGNSVFYRVSGYPPEGMIGRPHNLIRHPDMPKAVFKYFWEVLEARRPIVAYVKNMAADGSYYWVLAIAMPLGNEYVSIRIKPSSPLFATVKALYAELLAVEKKSGVAASYAALFERLQSLGFRSYEDFSREALIAELAGRDRASTGEPPTAARGRIDAIFAESSAVKTASDVLSAEASAVLAAYKDIKLVAFNMSIQAGNTGHGGDVMVTVATTFQAWADSVHDAIRALNKAVDAARAHVDRAILAVMMLRLQIDMLAFLARERAGSSVDATDEMRSFLQMAADVTRSALDDVVELSRAISSLANPSLQLREAINALSVIRQMSRVEAARDERGAMYEVHIAGLDRFICRVEEALQRTRDGSFQLSSGVGSIRRAVEAIERELARELAGLRGASGTAGKTA
jgi:aerotaxis receptor